MLKDCIGKDINVGDFVIYVVQGNRNAGIEFGWILDMVDKRETRVRPSDGQEYMVGDISVKIQHAEADGTRLTTQVVDIPAHWREHTPVHISNYYGTGYYPTWEERQEFYVDATYRDTGKPSTTTLKCSGTEHRLLVTKPIA